MGLLRGWHQRGATGRAGPGGEGGGLSEHQELESQADRRVATESHLPDHVEAGCRPLNPAQAVPSPWEARPFPRLAFISSRKGSGVFYVPALCSQSPSVLPAASDCSVPPSWTHFGVSQRPPPCPASFRPGVDFLRFPGRYLLGEGRVP